MANVGCLAVFQVAASDARQLVGELGTDRVSQDDITSLPVHQCYVRATIGTERMPAFSMVVRKPEPGDMDVARHIRAATADYTTGHATLKARDSSLDRLVADYRKGSGDEGTDGEPKGSVDRGTHATPDAHGQTGSPHRRRRDGNVNDGGVSADRPSNTGRAE